MKLWRQDDYRGFIKFMRFRKKLKACLFAILLAVGITACAQTSDDSAEYHTDRSPSGDYTLSATVASTADNQWLILRRRGKEIARYPFESYFGPVYWSPSGKYVAVDNHYGHYAWNVWVISLLDGSVITAHGAVRDPKYDRTLDHKCLPDVMAFPIVDRALKAVYPAYESDRDNRGILTITYGWEKGDILKFYHRIVFPKLWDTKGLVGEILTESKVTPTGIEVPKIASAKLVPTSSEDKHIPAEAARVLDKVGAASEKNGIVPWISICGL